MKNIILQHWSGEMNEISRLSSANISKYAEKIGAEYQMLRGDVFRANLNSPHPPIQKLHMLDEEFDEFDIVVMLDSDMFTRKGMNQNIFTDEVGAGWHGPIQHNLGKHLQTIMKDADPSCCYWGGSIYRFDKSLRTQLRKHLSKINIDKFCNRHHHGDEGIMHMLASYAKIKDRYFATLDWNYPSFEPNIKNAAIIHIRTKITRNGPKRTKMENYKDLVKRGLIDA